MKEYTFKGQYSLDDYIQMNRFYLKEMLFKKKTGLILMICLIIFLALFVFYLAFEGEFVPLRFVLLLLLIPVLFVFMGMRQKSFYKKYYKNDKLIKEERTYTINEKNISVETESGNLKLSKETINRIKFDKDSIYVFTAENAVQIIKERYLNSPEEFLELKSFFKQHYM